MSQQAPRWSSTKHYNVPDQAFYNGKTYTAIRPNTNNKPGILNSDWSSVASRTWARGTTYNPGDIVDYGGAAWIATAATRSTPGGPGWQQIPAWSATTSYSPGTPVLYSGVWTAARANRNSPPGDPWARVQETPYERALDAAEKSKQAKRYERELRAGLSASKHDPPPAPPDGLKVTLTGIGSGLTVDKNGRPLLPEAFVFQCGPLEQYTIAHTFNMGTYDTIDDDQFARRGSRQLDTWQFDSLAMYLGATKDGKHYLPGWVPYPTKESGGRQYHRPEWYVGQLRSLFDAGAPFRYTAAFKGSTTIHSTYALLTAFNEDYRHGEGDTIYLSAVSFMEWRDPRGTPPNRGARLPTSLHFRQQQGRYLAYEIKTGRVVKTASRNSGTTFSDLAREFYGDAGDWRTIAQANKCFGGSGSLPIFTRWFRNRKPGNVTINVPAEPVKKPPVRKTTSKHR